MSGSRLLSWDDYREAVNLFGKVGDDDPDDEEFVFVVGDPAPPKEWDELVEDAQYGEEGPDVFLDKPSISATEHKRYDDFGYPSWVFSDSSTTEDLESADPQLVGVTAFPRSAVRTPHVRVLTAADLRGYVDRLEAEYGEKTILFAGQFSPEGNFSIMHSDGECRIGSLLFPSSAFPTEDIRSTLNKGNQLLAGTLILDREYLTDDALAFIDDEKDVLKRPEEIEA